MKTNPKRPEDLGLTEEKIVEAIRSGAHVFETLREHLKVPREDMRVLDKMLQSMRRQNKIHFDRDRWCWIIRTGRGTGWLPDNAESVRDQFGPNDKKAKA